jgi:hypothetical protein
VEILLVHAKVVPDLVHDGLLYLPNDIPFRTTDMLDIPLVN